VLRRSREGHDEPALAFMSDRPGSGNQQLYNLVLPKDPQAFPKQDGTGPTWKVQLHIAFWLGYRSASTGRF
jgi:hypothetical protein